MYSYLRDRRIKLIRDNLININIWYLYLLSHTQKKIISLITKKKYKYLKFTKEDLRFQEI